MTDKRYKLGSDWLFRNEDFGGLLINKHNCIHIVLDLGEAQFLTLLESFHGNIEATLSIVEPRIKKKIKYKRMIKHGIIIPYEDSAVTIEPNKIFQNYFASPLEITIYPTLTCNLNCKFCFVKNKNKRFDELTAKKWIEIIKEAERSNVFSVSILGGEPTLYSEINELMLGISQLDINTTITSNGISMSEELIEIISCSDNIVPVFSVQSFNEKNEFLMGCDFKATLKTIENFLSKQKNVRINSVYTNQTVDDFYQIIDYCISHGIERYSIGIYTNTNMNNYGINYHTFEDARKLNDVLNCYIKQKYGKKCSFSVSIEGCLLYSAYPELEKEAKNLSEYEKKYFGCRAGRSKMEIYPNGDVLPCICYENVIQASSNIREHSIIDVWNNDMKMKELRASKCKCSSCLECGYYSICNGGCSAIREQEHQEQYLQYKDKRCTLHGAGNL